MEKTTIGQFLAILRKSNGLTQQEVAEKLGVSNKTVSCWERDACYPDISTIPALAELYSVTCDEILNAKRNPLQTQECENCNDAHIKKSEKEASLIVENMLARYENTQKIAVACVIFATLLSIAVAATVLSFSVKLVWAFFVTVPVIVTCIFVLSLVQYRLNFAIPCDERSFKTRKRLYLRKKRACDFMILCMSFFLPFTQALDIHINTVAYGIAFVVATFLILLVVEHVRRLAHPDFYPPCNISYAKKRLYAYTALFAILCVSVVSFRLIIAQTPLFPEIYGAGTHVGEIENLEEYLSTNGLPDKYQTSRMPTVNGQFAEYTYHVKAKDFDEKDLGGYANWVVNAYTFDNNYTVTVLYPVWHVSYEYTDPTSGQKTTVSKDITVFNRSCQQGFLTINDDGTYTIDYSDGYNYYTNSYRFAVRNFESTLTFGAIATGIMLIVYIVTCEIIKSVIAKKEISAALQQADTDSDDKDEKSQ